MNEMLKGLAEASGWIIPDERFQEIAAIYKATAQDTRIVREMDVTNAAPAIVFEAEQR